MPKLIDRSALAARLDTGQPLVLVEALPEKYWRDWRLPGARNLPHDQVEALAPRVLPDKSAEIIVYCASATCQNSHIAARRLEALGYASVAVFAGGKQDWHDGGLPVERGDAAVAA
jgi:rhodanese-related sulfurtransferase